jgi:CHASE3 domain sensor protein
VHEFGHSFVNSAIDQLPEELKKSTEYLYLPITDAMRKQSYTNWIQCLYEHFVRAGEVIIARQLGDTSHAEEIIRSNVKGGFTYLPFIVKKLEMFEKDINPNKNYNAFVETIMLELKEAYTK